MGDPWATHTHRCQPEKAEWGSLRWAMTKAELYAQIDSMTEEGAAQVKLIFAPEFDRHFGSLPTDGEG